MKITGEIVGGPLDGRTFEFESEELTPELLKKADSLRVNGHKYKIIDMDIETGRGVLLW